MNIKKEKKKVASIGTIPAFSCCSSCRKLLWGFLCVLNNSCTSHSTQDWSCKQRNEIQFVSCCGSQNMKANAASCKISWEEFLQFPLLHYFTLAELCSCAKSSYRLPLIWLPEPNYMDFSKNSNFYPLNAAKMQQIAAKDTTSVLLQFTHETCSYINLNPTYQV
mgnify:CR=1 FL=1